MPTLRTPRAIRRLAPTVAVALSLSACGGSGGAADTATGTEPQAATEQATPQAPPQNGQLRRPGASGLVAAVEGTTAQVQGNDSQTAVSWTGATAFTAQADGSLADVAVGACVVVRSTDGTSAGATAVTAVSVSVTEPVDGECAGPGGAGGFQGGGQGGGPPAGGARPSGAPRARPSGAPGSMRGGVSGATGQVTGATSEGFTVRSVSFGQPGEQGAEPQTQDIAVTVTGDTTVTTTVPAAADAVQPGVCVTASGEADTTGAVVATTISVRPAEDGECAGGFGGLGGMRAPGA